MVECQYAGRAHSRGCDMVSRSQFCSTVRESVLADGLERLSPGEHLVPRMSKGITR